MRAQRHPGSEEEWNYSPIVWAQTLYSPKTLPNLEKHYIYWSSEAPYKQAYSDPDKPCGHSSGALLHSDKASTISLPSSTSSDKPVTIASRQRPVFSSLSYSASRMTRSWGRLVEGTVPFVSIEGIPNEMQREGNYMFYSNGETKQSQANSSHYSREHPTCSQVLLTVEGKHLVSCVGWQRGS